MAEFTVHAAKTNLSKLLARAEAGEEIVIVRGKEPIARLVPIAHTKPKPQFGSLKGKVYLTDAFFEPLPEEELEAWGQV
jgi:prevent-host-death family protein